MEDEEWGLDREARLARARRMVAERCLYGVDKNPMAVQLAHVSLWLTTLAADLPLTFLDHHLRCGDSLVGTRFADLGEPVPDACLDAEARRRNKKFVMAQFSLFETANVQDLMETLLRHCEEMAGDDTSPADVQRKDQLLREDLRDPRYARVKDCLDFWCGLWFWPGETGAPYDTARFREALSALAGQQSNLGPAEVAKLQEQVREIAAERRFFHWELEFPELYWTPDGRRLNESESGFDAILGNPPFIGGQHISGSLGAGYRGYLSAAYAPAGATCDLCAYFFRRAFGLLRAGHGFGLVATKTISQGDTREGGLAVIVKAGGAITFARRFVKWPGAANVEVNLLAIHRGAWSRLCLLDGALVSTISSRLDTEPEAEPKRLRQNAGLSFQGSIVLGMGFVLEPEEAAALIAKDARNRDVLFLYLNGEDLNSRPDQSASRWVINFHDWSLARAETYTECMAIVREKVKTERERLAAGDATARDRARRWWQFARQTMNLYATIGGMERVLAACLVTEYWSPALVPTGQVFAHRLVVFSLNDSWHYALLQSSVHEAWARRYSSSLESRLNYTPSDCFETFPFPQAPDDTVLAQAAVLGGTYQEQRRQIMLGRSIGLTQTYNLFNDPKCEDGQIARLRELHAEVDRAIAACYGWQDLELGHGFHANERGKVRFTVSPEARRELLRRLLALNLEIAERERAGGMMRRPREKLAETGVREPSR